MQQKTSSDPRMDSMFGTDRVWAYGAVIVLWALYVFVLYAIMPHLKNDDVLTALAVVGALVLLFNTASVVAMIVHYSHDKEHIYGLDLHYQDIMNRKMA